MFSHTFAAAQFLSKAYKIGSLYSHNLFIITFFQILIQGEFRYTEVGGAISEEF